MYKLIAKILNGDELVKYEVLDMKTNRKKILSIEQVQGLAMAGSLQDVVFHERTQTLKGVNGNDLRRLARKQESIGKTSTVRKNCFEGSSLIRLVEQNTSDYRERYLVADLMTFLNNKTNGKICALYGLRRTGKTIMMFHAIKHLLADRHDDIAYITLTEQDSLSALYQLIDDLVEKEIHYLFLDEITAVNGFIQSCALLADKYARFGIHIVIAGTDSFVLELAKRDNLYDRMCTLHTAYIGYAEYEYLNPQTDLLDYIRFGGVLPADIFYNEEKSKDYINTAISGNIIHSLLRANNRKEHQLLLELNGRGLLKKAIEQAIAASNEMLTAYVITQTYQNGDLGSAKQLLEHIFDIDSVLDTEEVEERVRYKLSIVKDFDAEITESYIEELTEFLVEIGVIKMYVRYVGRKKREVPIFIQPGLRYHQTIALVNALRETESFYDIPFKVREELCRKIIEGVEGNLLEHEVLLSCLMKYQNKREEVTQISYLGKEIDMIVHDDYTIDMYEVKRSSGKSEEQYKWLVDNELNYYIEAMWGGRIRNRTVLYLGENDLVMVNGMEIRYQNMNQFLKV